MESTNTKKVIDAIKTIPNEEKRAYLMALARCPHLLHRESCIERFLQCDPNQAKKAAQRFVEYWEKRRQVYDDGAFLPLSLSESGVLSESCKILLQNGWISLLPPDKHGRRVCLLNLSVEKGSCQISQEDKARCIFFVLQCLSEEPSVRTSGIAIIVVYDNVQHTTPTSSIMAFEDILHVMPIKVLSLHVIHTGESEEDDDTFYESFLPLALKTTINTSIDGNHDAALDLRVRIHVNKSREKILEELERDGFKSRSLPVVLGGSWSSVHHGAWLKLRTQDERGREDHHQCLDKFSFPGNDLTTGKAPVGEVREKIRDAWHSRLKRIRKRCRTKAIQIRVNHLIEQQEKLKASTKFLEQALKDANRIVSSVEARKQSPLDKGLPSTVSLGSMSSSSLPSMRHPGPYAYAGDQHSLMGISSMATHPLISAIRAEQEMLLLSRMSAGSRFLPVPYAPPPFANTVVRGGIAHESAPPPQAFVYYAPVTPVLVPTHDSATSRRPGPLRPPDASPTAGAPRVWIASTPQSHHHLSARWY